MIACKLEGTPDMPEMNAADLWERYKKNLCRVDSVGLSLDISRMKFDDAWLAQMEPAMQRA